MSNIHEKTINAIRILSAEGVQKANSGHPGLPMGSAPIAYSIWAQNMKHNPKNPNWENRDRFVLSAGHGSMLVYSLLHLFGYGHTIEDLKNFRQLGSKTPGHPEQELVGVETTTGPLGQGISNAVGFAMAEEYLAKKFNREGYNVVDHYTYALAGDGCMMEGISSEACSFAGTMGLSKLIVFYDDNEISIEGSTDISFREDVAMRYEAYGWQVLKVADGNDLDAINAAVAEAKTDTKRPTLIAVTTEIGYGCPAKQGKASAHGEPLGEENLKCTKENLGWPTDKEFYVPQDVYDNTAKTIAKGEASEAEWNKLFGTYKKAFPELAEEWELWYSGKTCCDLWEKKDLFEFEGKAATRNSSGAVINKLTEYVPNLIGGSADLAPSTKTLMKGKGDFGPEDKSGANLHFGVREHAMAAIGNGLALHGGLKPYVATFFVFSDYMKGAMRLSALMKQQVVYVLTHDSIGVGEDGPTHQPIEQLASLRSIPGMTVIRPADSVETAAGWVFAINHEGPTALVLTRQNLPLYNSDPKNVLKGAYIMADSDKETPDAILIASGSEVEFCMAAKEELKAKGVDARVVSMPSMELFDKQSAQYKESVLPNAVRKRVGVEAASSFGWHKYVGLDGALVCMESFGTSGPQDKVFAKFGITTENVVAKTLELVK
jgi:transketolase